MDSSNGTGSACALQPCSGQSDLARALDLVNLIELVALVGPASGPGRRSQNALPMVRAYFFNRYPGSGFGSNVTRFHHCLVDDGDLRTLCGFSGNVPDRSTFYRVFRRLDDHSFPVDKVAERLSELLRERPWVVPAESVRKRVGPARPGNSNEYRRLREATGLGFEDFMDCVADEQAAERQLVEWRWPDGVRCPRCDSNNIGTRKVRVAPFRCRQCRYDFSVKAGTVMESSKLSARKWAIAMYMVLGGKKGLSALELAVALKIRHQSALHLLHRIRKGFEEKQPVFSSVVEVDETYVGGLEKNKHASKKLRAGLGATGKTPVVGVKDGLTFKVWAEVLEVVDGQSLREFVQRLTVPGTEVHTDQHAGYRGIPGIVHESVNHSRGEYVRDVVSTNGIDGFWSVLKRVLKGIFHQVSVKHLHRYLSEVMWRFNHPAVPVKSQMGQAVRNMVGRCLRLKDMRRGRRSSVATSTKVGKFGYLQLELLSFPD